MKILSCILLSAACLGFVACSESEQKDTTQATPMTPLNLATPAQATDTGAQQGAVAGVNPEHGQAGHRCDIPVGASLSLPVQPSLNVQPTVAPPTPNIQGAVAGGVNPPHGELGHDCSKPVGAPLD